MGLIESRLAAIQESAAQSSAVILDNDNCREIAAWIRANMGSNTWQLCGALDARDIDATDVRDWLKTLRLCGRVEIVWLGIGEGIQVEWDAFVENYDDIWYPASDDAVVVSADRTVMVELSHEELLKWYTAKSPETGTGEAAVKAGKE